MKTKVLIEKIKAIRLRSWSKPVYEVEVRLKAQCYGNAEYDLYPEDSYGNYDLEGQARVMFYIESKPFFVDLAVTVEATSEAEAREKVRKMFERPTWLEVRPEIVRTWMSIDKVELEQIKNSRALD